MYEEIAEQKGKWLLLEMQTTLGVGHVTAVRINEKDEIVFKETLDSVESTKLNGPCGIVFKDWASFCPKGDNFFELKVCRLFYYSKTTLKGGKYYEHDCSAMPNY